MFLSHGWFFPLKYKKIFIFPYASQECRQDHKMQNATQLEIHTIVQHCPGFFEYLSLSNAFYALSYIFPPEHQFKQLWNEWGHNAEESVGVWCTELLKKVLGWKKGKTQKLIKDIEEDRRKMLWRYLLIRNNPGFPLQLAGWVWWEVLDDRTLANITSIYKKGH